MGRLSKYTKETNKMLSLAREEVIRLCHRLIGTEHLLLAMLRLNDPLVEGLFISLHTSPLDIAQSLEFVIGRGRHALVSEPALSAAARTTLARAEEAAIAYRSELIGLEHILLGIFAEHDGIAMHVLESFGIFPEIARQQLEILVTNGYEHLITSIKYHALYDATPMLNLVCRDLTMEALDGQLLPLIGRTSELERVMQILLRRTKNNPVLIGPAGVGKTALLEGLAWRIIEGQVPDNLLHCRMVALDIGLLLSGTRFRGDFEERLQGILQEINDTPGIILILDELHVLVQAGSVEGSLDVANLFKPLLTLSTFRCIGATTMDAYRQSIECNPALERRFQAVHVSETGPVETLEILRGLRAHYETFHHVTITDEALQAAVYLSSIYVQNRYQPDNALDLVDEAASCVCVKRSLAPCHVQQLRAEVTSIQREKEDAITLHDFPMASNLLKRERRLRKKLRRADYEWRRKRQQEFIAIGEQDIAEIVALRTGIPIMDISQEEQLRLLNLEQELHQRIIGQDEAVRAVSRAIRRARTQIRDMRRPIGTFLFVGPVGVGKTELARALAVSLFGDEKTLLQYDMSEFVEYHQISRLIGSPPGYIGYEQGGQLTEAVRRHPYCVILFDEIEKAHPKILDLLLQIVEDGNLTDARGQLISFKHAIIIITSHIGAEYSVIKGPLSSRNIDNDHNHSYEKMHQHVLTVLKQTFRAELLNRIDEIIVFHPLMLEHLHKIVCLLITQTRKLLARQAIELVVTDAACLLLVERGCTPEYGARPLRHTVQHLLEDILADAILEGRLTAGDTVEAEAANGHLYLRTTHPQNRAIA
jgi:ATP-dependent Clp protease ATP-binding subunit ClpC